MDNSEQKVFWLRKGEQNYGPYDESEIRIFIQEKRLTSEDYIYDVRKSSWSKVDEISPSYFKRFTRIIKNPIFLLIAWIINMLLIVKLVSDFDTETIEFSILGVLHLMYLVIGFVCIFIPFFFRSFLELLTYYWYTWAGSLASASIGWTGLIILVIFSDNDSLTGSSSLGLGGWLILSFFMFNALLGTGFLGSLILGKTPFYIKVSLGTILLVILCFVWTGFLKVILVLGTGALAIYLFAGICALIEKIFNSQESTTTEENMTKTQANLIIILLLVALGFPFLGIQKPAPKWEYKIEVSSDILFTINMDKYGADGWELVTARIGPDGNGGRAYECIFKRLK